MPRSRRGCSQAQQSRRSRSLRGIGHFVSPIPDPRPHHRPMHQSGCVPTAVSHFDSKDGLAAEFAAASSRRGTVDHRRLRRRISSGWTDRFPRCGLGKASGEGQKSAAADIGISALSQEQDPRDLRAAMRERPRVGPQPLIAAIEAAGDLAWTYMWPGDTDDCGQSIASAYRSRQTLKKLQSPFRAGLSESGRDE
jgi:hypothetical protein